MESSSIKKASKQACDSCRRRKLKCNRSSPCDKCHNALLSCSYSDVLQRKGPKVRSLGALSSLRPSSSSSASSPSDFGRPSLANDVIRNVTSGHPHDVDIAFSSTCPASASAAIISTTIPTTSHPACMDIENSAPPPFTTSMLPASMLSPVDTTFASAQQQPCGPAPHQGRLSALVLLAHVNVFLKYLFPIMPVFQADEVLRDSANPEELSPPRYTFLVAMCAATHIQLKLDGNERTDVTEDGMRPEGQALMSGDSLLAEAVRARQQYDPIEYSNIDNLLTSFFLFCTYGNMDKQNYAWFYLSQSVALANTLGICEFRIIRGGRKKKNILATLRHGKVCLAELMPIAFYPIIKFIIKYFGPISNDCKLGRMRFNRTSRSCSAVQSENPKCSTLTTLFFHMAS